MFNSMMNNLRIKGTGSMKFDEFKGMNDTE